MTVNAQEFTEVNQVFEEWDYSYFRHYLLALARGHEFTLPLSQFPQRIELSKDWHELFEKMRKESAKDGLERWAPIGYKEDKSALYLPAHSVKGEEHQVPRETTSEHIKRMKEQFHIPNLLGDIHTHPRPTKRFLGFESPSNSPARFSATDYFNMVGNNGLDMMVVIEGQEELMALKSKGTVPTPSILKRESFERHWITKVGVKTLTEPVANTPLTSQQAWEINLMIAQRHNLVLYKNSTKKSGFDKIFPTK